MSKKETKALPFDTSKGFNAMPNAVSEYYVRHPRFTPTTERIYRYLLQRHNADYGYAWPSWASIMDATNVGSRDTVSKSLASLEYLGLIKRFKHGNEGAWDNNGYTFLAPIEDEDEFYRKFGEELGVKYRRKKGEMAPLDWL